MALLATIGAVAGGFPAAVAAFIVGRRADHADRAVDAARPARRRDPEVDRERDAGRHPAQALPRAVPGDRQGAVARRRGAAHLARVHAASRAAMRCRPPSRSRSPRWRSTRRSPALRPADLIPHLEFVMPVFTWEAMVNIALPLFIVTMAGQNLPGLAVLVGLRLSPARRAAAAVHRRRVGRGRAVRHADDQSRGDHRRAVRRSRRACGSGAPLRRRHFRRRRLRAARRACRRRGGAGRALAAGADRGGRRPRVDRCIRRCDVERRAGGRRPAAGLVTFLVDRVGPLAVRHRLGVLGACHRSRACTTCCASEFAT